MDALSQTVDPSTIAIKGRFERDDSMFWGISAFNVSRGTTRNFNLQTDYYSGGNAQNHNYSTNIGTYGM